MCSYTWGFRSFPADGCPSMSAPCTESYCQKGSNPSYTTSPVANQFSFGPALTAGRTCGPIVYPVVYALQDRTALPHSLADLCNATDRVAWEARTEQLCTHRYDMNDVTDGVYKALAATASHVGNSAYFTPTRQGEYVVEMAVDDGCS